MTHFSSQGPGVSLKMGEARFWCGSQKCELRGERFRRKPQQALVPTVIWNFTTLIHKNVSRNETNVYVAVNFCFCQNIFF